MSKRNRTIEASSDLFDGKGSIATRVQKLQHLQDLGFVDKKHSFARLAAQPVALEVAEGHALKQARAASRTSGVMIRTTVGGPDPRVHTQWTTYEGDPEVCWGPFKKPGFVGTINLKVDTREETVRLKPGQRVQIVSA
jgi:hypothetical protein